MTFTMTEKFYLYDKETDKFLVELLFGEKVWLQEGELDSVPRIWTFTEEEIIEKFGAENLKYKVTLDEFEDRRLAIEIQNREVFYDVESQYYYHDFGNAMKRLATLIADSSADESVKRFVLDELDKIDTIFDDRCIRESFDHIDTDVTINVKQYSLKESMIRIKIDSSDDLIFHTMFAERFDD